MIDIVICTMNNEDTIQQILEPIKMLNVILVDKSTDKTIKIAKKFKNVSIIKQKSEGLAAARNLGIKACEDSYIMMLGSDNIIEPNSIFNAIKEMIKYGWAGIGIRTTLLEKKDYLSKCSDIRWKYRFTEGEKQTIGTPYIYRAEILKEYMFDEDMTDSDDSDLCKRLREDGYRIGYSKEFCYEIGFESKKALKERFQRYGLSDSQYYNKHVKYEGIKRKIKSWLHPLTCEFIPNIYYLPYYFMIVYYRYKGWIKNV